MDLLLYILFVVSIIGAYSGSSAEYANETLYGDQQDVSYKEANMKTGHRQATSGSKH
ncbi:MAG: hypothetical protein MZV70_11715 [Desulfobacterales bacterium]|nr:hypothetical protein [Desulfobacterales bacterium]